MKVKDLTKIGGETMYQVVDASRQGCMTTPVYLHIGADMNVIGGTFADYDVIAFEVPKKNWMVLYAVKPEEVEQ